MKKTLLAAMINLMLISFLYWLMTTDSAQRAIDVAKGWRNAARVGWIVARWVGGKAILAELHYHEQMEKLQ